MEQDYEKNTRLFWCRMMWLHTPLPSLPASYRDDSKKSYILYNIPINSTVHIIFIYLFS